MVDSLGEVAGVGKATSVPGAPNNLINLRLLCKDIGGSFEGDVDLRSLYLEVADKLGSGFYTVS